MWSDETCKIYGLSTDNKIHTREEWEEFIHPDDLEYVRKVSNEELTSQGYTAFHHRIRRRNGDIRYVFSQASLEYDTYGNAIGLIGAVHDITETRKAEEALAQSESNLRLIMDLIPQSIFAKDIEGTYLFVNKAFASLYGVTPEELVGKKMSDSIPESGEAKIFNKQDVEVIATGNRISIPDHTFTDSKGNVRSFNTIKIPFIVAGPKIIASLGVSNEITEQKQVEEERTKMIADIIQRNKDLEQFSYIVSHNLRAPVANIMGLSEILQIPELNNEEQGRLITDLGICVNKLDEVIIDINNVLRFKSKEGYKKENIKFSKIIDDIKIGIEATIKNEGVSIITEFSQVDDLFTLKTYIHSIFHNLISNSIKYRQLGINPLIEISSARNGNTICLTFKDNGLGIDLAKCGAQVFGLYKRFHGHIEGKGMGLFMVKTQVESLGGKISIESEVNKGTIFYIEFELN